MAFNLDFLSNWAKSFIKETPIIEVQPESPVEPVENEILQQSTLTPKTLQTLYETESIESQSSKAPMSVGDTVSSLIDVPASASSSVMSNSEIAGVDISGVSEATQQLLNSVNSSAAMQKQLNTEALERAKNLSIAKLGITTGNAISSGLQANDYVKQVKATKSQYETQKQMLDLNLKNTETLLAEELMQNISDLDVMSAAKNVDVRSGGIQTMKSNAAQEMNKDISMQQTQNKLTKLGLDLQYKLNVASAKRQRNDTWAGLLSIGTSAATFLASGKTTRTLPTEG